MLLVWGLLSKCALILNVPADVMKYSLQTLKFTHGGRGGGGGHLQSTGLSRKFSVFLSGLPFPHLVTPSESGSFCVVP